jgi:hypothetical protein
MKTFKQFLAGQEELEISELIVTFKNTTSKAAPALLFENNLIEEGKQKEWGNGYSYRLDKRPENQGGNQLHIFGRKGQAWAYRHTGAKSEPNKYTSAPTNTVKDIVTDIFGIDRSNIQEVTILDVADQSTLLVEVLFA